jgi:DNA (cytosine-5)-methyltransferase 1
MLRVIQEAKPTWIIGENVAGIVNLALDQVCADLEGQGYEVEPIIVPACGVDAPHRRNRVWIVAHSNNKGLQGCWGFEKCESQLPFGKGCSSEQKEWLAEPNVGRVANGIPNRSHRLKGLGNAIVPQVASEIIRCINKIMEDNK